MVLMFLVAQITPINWVMLVQRLGREILAINQRFVHTFEQFTQIFCVPLLEPFWLNN